MPVVTDIQQQQRDGNRYSIFVDHEFAFGLDGLEFGASSLKVGQELTAEEVEDWQRRSTEGKAYQAATHYLSYRRRSRMELKQYLVSKDYTSVVIERTVERLEQSGLLDDGAFAAAWIADRQQLKPRSRRQLISELRHKGLDAATIELALDEQFGPELEREALERIIAKVGYRYRDEAKLIAYLSSLGYNYRLIREAIGDND